MLSQDSRRLRGELRVLVWAFIANLTSHYFWFNVWLTLKVEGIIEFKIHRDCSYLSFFVSFEKVNMPWYTAISLVWRCGKTVIFFINLKWLKWLSLKNLLKSRLFKLPTLSANAHYLLVCLSPFHSWVIFMCSVTGKYNKGAPDRGQMFFKSRLHQILGQLFFNYWGKQIQWGQKLFRDLCAVPSDHTQQVSIFFDNFCSFCNTY